MPVVRAIRCPQCGSAIDLHQVRSRHVGCVACGAQLDLKDDDPTVKEMGTPWKGPRPIELGRRGVSHGVEYEVVAHLQYREEDWGWSEFLLLADDGRQVWLQFDEGRWTAYTPFTPEDPQPVDAHTQRLKAKGIDEAVIECGRGAIAHIAGELTWQAKIGDSVFYLDTVHYAAEIGPREIEWFKRSAVSKETLASFGVTRPSVFAGLSADAFVVVFVLGILVMGVFGAGVLAVCSSLWCMTLVDDRDGDCAVPIAKGGSDCDDNNPRRGPYETEIAGDGLDQDCDNKDLCYVDRDYDGWGQTKQTIPLGQTCASLGFVTRGGDCNDNSSTIQTGCYDDDEYGGGHYGGGGFGGGK